MRLASGTRLGPFEVGALLGAGGMGEVYRARDTALDRDVALKVLPDAVAADPERLARFEREARTLALLNHPNIAQIHGVEQSGSTRALVMELVEGPTLAERIARGPMPIDEAVAVAAGIASALEAAHDQGVVHRDLKPANVKVRPDGTVKVLDFGLAKAGSSRAPAASDVPRGAAADAVTSPATTHVGTVLGTAAYMAPEQAQGRSADARSDIWAFGVVLFEMLTGRALFSGESAVEVIGAVLRQPIDLSQLPAATPASIRRLLRRCLDRDPKQRLHSMADVRLELRDAVAEPEPPPAPAARRLPMVAGGLAAVVSLLGAAVWIGGWRSPAEPVRGTLRFSIPRPTPDAGVPVVSPDGRHIAYAAGGRLIVRPLDESAPRALVGTDGATEPFWSPDSRAIGFFAGGHLKRAGLSGQPPETLAAVPAGWLTASWSSTGDILVEIVEGPERDGWYLWTAGSSSLRPLVPFDPDRPVAPFKAFPAFLPDGVHFLFTHPRASVATLQVGSMRSPAAEALTQADSRPIFAPPGHVLFARQGSLIAQRFDPRVRRLLDEPQALVDDVDYFPPTGEGSFSASHEGTLVYRRRAGRSTLQWVDRQGRRVRPVLDADWYLAMDLSTDGTRLLVEKLDIRRGTTDLWLVDLVRTISTRETSSASTEMRPTWAPDGHRYVFSADYQGSPNLYLAETGSEPRVLVPFDRTQQFAGSWTPDGQHVLYDTRNDAYQKQIWIVDVGSGSRRTLFRSEFNDGDPVVSPDGRWVAYVSDASGRNEVYLRTFPGAASPVRVSDGGGSDPAWRADSRELFFAQPGGLMSVAVDADTSGRPRPGRAATLFALDERRYRAFAVAPDGQQVLLNLADSDGVLPPDEVIVGWTRLLEK